MVKNLLTPVASARAPDMIARPEKIRDGDFGGAGMLTRSIDLNDPFELSIEEKIFVAGKVSDFKIGEVVAFRKEKTFVVRLEGGFLAISSVCTHLHCIVNWNAMSKRFECPCHGAKFNKEGEVLEGPPPRPLDINKLEVAAGNVVIDTGVTTERKKFDPSQLVKA